MSGRPGSGQVKPCDFCGTEIYVRLSRLLRSKHHFCSTKCQMDWLHEQFRAGAWRDEIQRGQQQRYRGHRVEVTCPQCGRTRIISLSDSIRGRKFCDSECYLAWFKQYITESKAEWIEKSKHKTYLQPNKVEQKLISILEAYFPDEWLYTGAGRRITINRMRPDFFNKNDRKEIIEVFGNFYHSPKVAGRKEARMIKAYKELGFNCLILWENEILKLEPLEIVDKIKAFRR